MYGSRKYVTRLVLQIDENSELIYISNSMDLARSKLHLERITYFFPNVLFQQYTKGYSEFVKWNNSLTAPLLEKENFSRNFGFWEE